MQNYPCVHVRSVGDGQTQIVSNVQSIGFLAGSVFFHHDNPQDHAVDLILRDEITYTIHASGGFQTITVNA